MWIIILTLSIIFYANASGLFALIIVISAVFLLMCILESINYFLTPEECIKIDECALYFFSGRKWNKLSFTDLDEVRTNGQTSAYTSMRSILDRGVLRIFDRTNTLYRVKYLREPEDIKRKINTLKAQKTGGSTNTGAQINNTDKPDNTINTNTINTNNT